MLRHFYKNGRPLFQELEAIKARVREMEEEAEKLKQMQTEVTKEMPSPGGSAASLNMSFEEKVEVDARYLIYETFAIPLKEVRNFHGDFLPF